MFPMNNHPPVIQIYEQGEDLCTTVFPNDSIFRQTAHSILQLFCQNSPELTTQHFSLLNAYYLSPLMSYHFLNTEGQRDQLLAMITYKRVNREVNQNEKQ